MRNRGGSRIWKSGGAVRISPASHVYDEPGSHGSGYAADGNHMQILCFLRHDGRYGRFSEGTGICGYADDCIFDRRMRFPASLDIYLFPHGAVPYGVFPVSDLSGELATDLPGACGMFLCRPPQTGPKMGRMSAPSVMDYRSILSVDRKSVV